MAELVSVGFLAEACFEGVCEVDVADSSLCVSVDAVDAEAVACLAEVLSLWAVEVADEYSAVGASGAGVDEGAAGWDCAAC